MLELPQHTIYSSQTQTGDRLLICTAAEMEIRLQALASSCSGEGQEGTKSTALKRMNCHEELV